MLTRVIKGNARAGCSQGHDCPATCEHAKKELPVVLPHEHAKKDLPVSGLMYLRYQASFWIVHGTNDGLHQT
eukprot:1159763-Pelagomonas_calceolata.AAC.9